MRWKLLFLPLSLFLGCESRIGSQEAYPSIYTKQAAECRCEGVMYLLKNPDLSAQRVSIVRVRQSGTGPKQRQELKMTLQPKTEKKLGCSEINLSLSKDSPYCDAHQSFYVKRYRELSYQND